MHPEQRKMINKWREAHQVNSPQPAAITNAERNNLSVGNETQMLAVALIDPYTKVEVSSKPRNTRYVGSLAPMVK